ncbi:MULTISPECIES: hypothetical protein [unclassified Arthrobacter]|uniref:hypothetical protein n=1 Tax=unclassified Arthrobacter TaxID=235627 RepID=UPI001492D0AD|nr:MULTISPECIES: hypothetical protein [unclassified Arthrobacter]NOJ63364.1 hypothetical protein [Arthrobacter sp. 147(2020)]
MQPNAKRVMIECPEHGPQSVTGVVEGEGIASVEITGGSWPCPKCRRIVPIIDGKYTFFATGTRADLRLTPQQIMRIDTAIEWALKASEKPGADHEKIERKIRKTLQKEAPGITSMVDKALGAKGAGLAAWIAIMLAVIGMFQDASRAEITPELIEKIIEEVAGDQESSDMRPKESPEMPTTPQSREEPESRLRT